MTAQVRDHSRSRAQRLLEAIGWRPLANKQRQILLEDVLAERIRAINSFEFQGERHRFSEEAIDSAVKSLATSRGSSTAQENERVWRLLRFGVFLEQTIDGHLRSYAAQYIDWAEPSNNVYHLIGDFEATTGRYTPDIVLFVNGIPLVV